MHKLSFTAGSLALGTAMVLWAAAAGAAPVELAGATLQDRASVAGNPVVLNGAGIRYKTVFKVYTAGLYLGEKASTPEAVLAM